jgi:hypothetical protein
MAGNEIIKAKGIRVSTPLGSSTDVYGGYAYSLSYSIGFENPSTLEIKFVSEDGNYNEGNLKNRIFPGGGSPFIKEGGAISTDTITFGNEKIEAHPIKYIINNNSSGRFLTIHYLDKSIILDKIIVALKGKHYPPIYMPQYLGGSGDRTFNGGIPVSPYILGVGNPYYPRKMGNSGVLTKSEIDKESKYVVPQYLYTPYELYLAIINNPILAGRLLDSIQLLWQIPKAVVGDSLNWSVDQPNNPDNAYLKNYAGTLREVLSRWGGDFGFSFYWESQKGVDKLGIMDIRNGLAFAHISQKVSNFISTADSNVKGLVSTSHSYDIGDTSSRAVAGYLGIDGQENAITYKTNFKPLDLITLPIWSCNTIKGVDSDKSSGSRGCEVEVLVDDDLANANKVSSDSKRFNLPNYCNNKRPYTAIRMDSIRSKYEAELEGGETITDPIVLASYVRLIKASLISPEFYRAFVLLKKASSSYEDKAFQLYNKFRSFDINQTNSHNFDVNQIPQGLSFLDPNADKNPKQIVNLLYNSGGSGGNKNHLGYKNNLCYPNPQDLNGGGYAADKLEKDNQLSSYNFIIGKDCISLQRVNSKQFQSLIFSDDTARDAAAGAQVDRANTDGLAQDDTSHLGVYRLKKYGNSKLVESPGDDHIYKLLNTIGQNQGRFYYHPAIIKQEEMAQRNYVDQQVQWIYRYECTENSVFSDLQQGIDPVSEYRRKPMPNECVEHKDRESNQKDVKGLPFISPNSANLTVEQFIQKVYAEEITGSPPTEEAILAVTDINSSNGGINSITVIYGGDGYKNGTIAVTVLGKNTSQASASATVVAGVITEVNIIDGGLGYSSDDVIAVVDDPTATGQKHNVFGELIDCANDPIGGKLIKQGVGEECMDCITSSNRALRDAEYTNGKFTKKVNGKKVCTPPDDGGILIIDKGTNQISIPASVEPFIEKYTKSFQILSGNSRLDLITYHSEQGYKILILPTVGKVPKGRENDKLGAGFGPVDELDWIVDQVSVPNLDLLIMQDAEDDKGSKNSWAGQDKDENSKARNKDLNAIMATYMGRGPKFETAALIEAAFDSNIARVEFAEVEPSQEDLGVEEAECLDPKAKAEKIRADQKKMKENMRKFVEGSAFYQGDPQFNATFQIMGNGLYDNNGNDIDIFIQDGLEGLNAELNGDGISFTYTVGSKRKIRQIQLKKADMWVKAKPQLYNNVFDI